MPFKIKLKKSKQQYNVASKSVYVISVELLDNVSIECTLTADSTGRDCMDNVSQRLGLQQPDLFGLRYVSRRSYPKIRWVDLDRPLKKQLDKYAQEPYLYLGVMFYVHDVSLLEDEVTRYHYFLQLKLDVIEGRLRCNYEQAIVLASYSLQAEFGDHDQEKHTLEYLQDFPLLPKPMLTQFPEDKIGTLTDAIITQHASLRSIAPQLAEVYYIVGAQQLDGYGQECFLAKDERGNEVLIGASLTGIVVRKGNGQSPQFFKWHDITNLVNHKRYFGIECQNYEFSVQFMLDEPDSAKYVWKMCVLQHTFYKLHASATESNELNITLENNQPGGGHQPQSQLQHQQPRLQSHFDGGQQQQQQQAASSSSSAAGPQQQQQQYELLNQFDAALPNTYPTTIQHSEIQSFHQQQTQRVDMSPMKLATSTTALSKQQQQQVLMDQHHQTLDATANNSTINNTTIQQSFNNYVLRPSNSTASNLNDPSAAYSVQGGGLGGGSGTTAILTNAHSVNDLDEVGAATLPQYRPAPDYETAIRNKYGIVQKPQQLPPLQQQQTNLQQQQLMYNSQPSLITDALLQHQQQQQQQHHQQQQQQQQHQQNNQNHFQQQPQHYHPNHTFGGHNITLDPQQQQHNLQYAENTYSSTPELNRVNLSRHGGPALSGDATQDQIVAELQRLNLYKPPPPYPGPYAKLSSTSTPDLAGGSNFGGGSNLVGMGGSSPDLVSRRNLSGARHHHMENGIHRTFGNLHAMDKGDNQVLANDYRNALSTEELRNESVVYRIENNNILSTPSNYVAYSRTVSEEPIYQNQQQVAAMTSSQNLLDENGEPIYQNLPVHEKILYKQRLQQQQQKEHELLKQQVLMQQQQTTNSEQPQQLQPESAQEEIETNASDSIHIDETVESADPLQNAILNPKVASMAPDMLITSSKLKGHVSRVAITNSRENLHSDSHVFNIQDHNHSDQSPEKKKSVTKISIGAVKAQEEKENFAFPEKVPRKAAPPPPPPPSLHHLPKEPASSGFVQLDSESSTVVSANVRKNNLINSKKSTALPGTSSSSSSYTSSHHQDNLHRAMNAAHPEHDEVLDDPVARHQLEQRRKKSSTTDYSFNFTGVVDAASSSSSTPRTPSSKPRAGRKRWALNFGSKTGSLKSVKSESGSHKSQDSLDGSSTLKSGFGPMMMATLHGLTRSRPDLLAESMATFSQPSKMPKDEIGTYLESKLEEGEVLREFERIPKKKHQNCHFNVAVMAENIPRNRFKDVLPYDENRVKLTTADKDNKSGYINASHVSATVGPDQRFYIAAQGPLPHTIHQFWQMVMQCDVYLIVMLTEASAAPKTSSCIPYWPTKDAASVDLGDFRIVNKYSNVDEANGSDNLYVTSRFQVTHLPTKTKRTVWHLQYSDWSDHGCPSNVKRYIEFLEEVSALRSHTSTEIPVGRNRNPPVLVHCSAGVGRTGVTILCDILLYCVDHNMDIDIPKVLSHLRQQRMLMVQTIAQYKFVHTVLINYLKQSRLI